MTDRAVRWATTAALLMSVAIVVTGGVVRLTGSGLGCPQWPACTAGRVGPTPEMGLHGVIEFGNRLLTWVLCAAVGAAILTARLRPPWRRALTRLGWAQFGLVMGNAVLGGITVLTGLNPYTVAAHFLLAMGLIAVATRMWHRAREGDTPPVLVVSMRTWRLAWLLLGLVALLLITGTLVTGAGPHAGDSAEVHRMPLDWEQITRLHAVVALGVLGLTALLRWTLAVHGAPTRAKTAASLLLISLAAQSVIGSVQSLTGLPEIVVGTHLLGAALVWIAAWHLTVTLRSRESRTQELDSTAANTGERPAQTS